MAEKEDRFKFGENWRDFADHLGPEDYEKAKTSLQSLLPDLTGKSFLDVGCGSGLFSIAACALGASRVRGIDLDATGIQTARYLVDKVAAWDAGVQKGKICFEEESILDPARDTSPYDVVYSWGVLHHTGQMHNAFDAAIKSVAPQGILCIAIYNRHFTAPIWKGIKWTYVKGPGVVKKLLVWTVFVVKLFAAFIFTRRNPFKRRRGMHYYNDIVDWVGGYPYEYASVEEVTHYFTERGFECVKVNKTQGFTGCNEFVFVRRK